MNFVRVVVLVLTVTNSCFGQSARDIARTAFKSVVLLEMNDSNGQPLSLGSGNQGTDGMFPLQTIAPLGISADSI